MGFECVNYVDHGVVLYNLLVDQSTKNQQQTLGGLWERALMSLTFNTSTFTISNFRQQIMPTNNGTMIGGGVENVREIVYAK